MKKKTDDISRSQKLNLVRRIIDFVKPHKRYFFLACLLSFFSVGLTLLNPVLIGKAIDHIVGVGDVNFTLLGRMLVIIAVASVFSAVFEWFAEFTISILAFKTSQGFRKEIFNKINSSPLKFIDSTPHGDIMNAMIIDTDNITTGFLEGFQNLFNGVITILFSLGFMLSINVPITAVVIGITPIGLLIAIFITKKSKKLFRKQVTTMAKVSSFTEEMFGNQKVITAFNHEDDAIEKFDQMNEELYSCSEKAIFYSTMTNPATRFVNGLVYGMTGIVCALSAISGKISVGQISSFLSYSQQFTKPFNEITGMIADLQMAFASARRVFDILDTKNEESDLRNEKLGVSNGNIEINNVYFSYSKDYKLIQDFNLKVKKGQKVAIVGPTGCGKSTLINLLMRFYDVDSGEILMNKKNIRSLTRSSVRLNYGMVLQESWLFHGTIRENIAYAKQDATFDEIIEAAKLANAHQFIERMPQGYDTVISEHADNVSAGQKQLICIARIMLNQPPLLILDEATSNIDTRTEQRIQEALDNIMKGRTCFIVAHRLSTIVNADIILVMNKGNVIEQGSHAELMAQNGFYTDLFNSQFSVY